MRVLYFHQHFSTPDGAVGTRSFEMARRMTERGHHVTMVCGKYRGGITGLSGAFDQGRRRGTIAGIDIIEHDLDYANADGFAKRIATFASFAIRSLGPLFTERYDLIFATTTPLTAAIPGIVGRWLRGKPFVFEVRDLWPELPRAMGVIRNPVAVGVLSALEWLAYRSAQRLVGLSPGIVEGFARRGVAREKITMVPNGCDLTIFGSEVEPWRPAGIATTDLLAVFAGTHGTANGLGAILNAAAELQRRGRTEIKLLLVGQGKLKPALVGRARREGLDNVVFLDPINKKQLAGLMASTDVGLQILSNVPAFYYGTSPNKFFDYIAAGVPVLNNYPGWLADMIAEHRCGFAVPPDDPSAFADALERAAANRTALREMGRRGRTLAEKAFDRAKLADRLVDWLEEAVK